MTGSQTTQGVVLGATTTAAGIVILPNTGGNTLLTLLSLVTIVAGCAVMASFVFARLGNISR